MVFCIPWWKRPLKIGKLLYLFNYSIIHPCSDLIALKDSELWLKISKIYDKDEIFTFRTLDSQIKHLSLRGFVRALLVGTRDAHLWAVQGPDVLGTSSVDNDKLLLSTDYCTVVRKLRVIDLAKNRQEHLFLAYTLMFPNHGRGTSMQFRRNRAVVHSLTTQYIKRGPFPVDFRNGSLE